MYDFDWRLIMQVVDAFKDGQPNKELKRKRNEGGVRNSSPRAISRAHARIWPKARFSECLCR